jgi:hypothetical protein
MNTQDWNNASPGARLLWNRFSNDFAIDTITRLRYTGAIAGSEFLVYNAAKLYFCLFWSTNVAAAGATPAGFVTYRNEADAVMLTTYTYGGGYTFMPMWFSRLEFTAVVFTHFNFIGYRITL